MSREREFHTLLERQEGNKLEGEIESERGETSGAGDADGASGSAMLISLL